ncbi:hypothetical protein R82526_04469 [Ralstonia mannitolilytica]|uniref:DUF1415 domain-containing protein n=1 Tax=Ralstonia mannitolilytica TaxID=105219 RepID=UPI0007AFF760|nr:DUF1415 family protein [Ralstonia mannitolilytica]ATG18669.1 DUF1415 domain-containing protein [Ralstonia pickettii]ANA33189.1 hypothetical protein VZ52_07080 [Ralstonia mannitolilytica]CAJ0696312.1 hypothetical protein R82526_04469 [Ralstonia mannitolilytica]CAJ0705080.1 hypothetical protein LMG18102_04383 [Ralstonia mannitolilytica]CAJ0718874.1 hypothetical protein LMG8323_04061 [Ralstonia mannitolilytica]
MPEPTPDFTLLDPPADALPLDPSAAADHVARVQRWLEDAVIGLNLCPFAKAVHVKQQVRYVVSRATLDGDVLDHLRAEAERLRTTPAAQIDTTLLIVPALADFLDFHTLTERAETLLAKAGYEGELQLASFHPDFVFADAAPDDIANATNRAPSPILHLLREDSIARATAAVPDAADIYERNIATMERLGPEGWAALTKKFSKAPPRE